MIFTGRCYEIEDVRKINNQDNTRKEKDYTDEEIIVLMERYATDYSDDYNRQREYWVNSNEGHIRREKIVLSPIKEIDEAIIKKHLDTNVLDADKYFNLFNKVGFENLKELILYLCKNDNTTKKLTDEQVISVYKAFPMDCRDDFTRKEFFKRLKNIVLENKFSDVISRNDEIIRLFDSRFQGGGIDKFITLSDVYKIQIQHADLKYIINNLELPYSSYSCGREFACFLDEINRNKKHLLDDEMKNILFNKLKDLNDYELHEVMFKSGLRDFPEKNSWFVFDDILNEEQLNYLCSRFYNYISKHKYDNEKKEPERVVNARKYNFLKYFGTRWKSPTADKQKKSLVDVIVDQMISVEFNEENVKTNFNLIHCLTEGAVFKNKNDNFSKESLTKLLREMENNNNFLYASLDSSCINWPYEFEFVYNNIIEGIGTLKILELLNNSIDLKSETLTSDVQKVFEIIKNIVTKQDKENQPTKQFTNKEELEIMNVFNKLFEIQYVKKEEKNSQILKYLNVDVFKYLNDENKDKMLMHIKTSKWDNILSLITNEVVNYDQFVKLWNYDKENKETHFSLINEFMISKKVINDERFLNLINSYVMDNKLDYIRYVEKNENRSWTDLEISFMCEVESFENIASYLNNAYRFTAEQWDTVFRHFYKSTTNPFVPFDFALKHYLEFDEEYKALQNGITYKDSGLVNQKEVSKLIKKVRKLAKKDQEAFDNEPLPF